MLVGDARWTWRIAVATFTVFTVATGYALATGQDCNCVAQSISPKHMLLLDGAVLALAMLFRPHKTTGSVDSKPILKLSLCTTIGVAFSGVALLGEQIWDKTDPLEFLIADMMG